MFYVEKLTPRTIRKNSTLMFQDARSSTSLKACAVYTRVKQEGGKRKVNSNRSYQKWKEYPFFFCKSLVHFVHVRAS